MANVKPAAFVPTAFSVMFTKMQTEAIEAAARREGRKKSAYARRAVVKELIRRGMYDPEKDPDNEEGLFEDGGSM